MNGVFQGVLAGLDFAPEVLGVLSLLGAAMLLLLAWARTTDRQAVRVRVVAPARLPIARVDEVVVDPSELARSCGTTRAPPGLPSPIRTSGPLRASARD
jgi:hypothetical protein